MIWLFNPITLLVVYIAYTRLPKNSLSYYTVMVIGAVIDCVVNITWFSLIYWDIPKEWLLTQRTERLKSASGYRGKLANLICKLLNYFEPGHCK